MADSNLLPGMKNQKWTKWLAPAIIFVVALVAFLLFVYLGKLYVGKIKSQNTVCVDSLQRVIDSCVYLSDSLKKQVSEKDGSIKSIRQENSTCQNIENNTLSKLNLSALSIVPMGWNAKKIKDAVYYMGEEEDLNYNIYDAIVQVVSQPVYLFMKKAFITKAPLWRNAFVSNKAVIVELKKVFELPKVNEDILPYLEGKDEKKYYPEFIKFYRIHSTSKDAGVNTHPKWDVFQKGFFVKFPDAFGGEKDEYKLLTEYKKWRTSYVIPLPARKVLVDIIRQYNAM